MALVSSRPQRGTERLVSGFLAACCLSSVTGCATIVHGRHQDVAVTSSPSGARVSVGGKDQGTTPTRVPLERKKTGIVLRFEKEGFQPAELTLGRTTSGWIALDVLAGAGQFANQGLSSTGQQAGAAAMVAAVSLASIS